MLHWFILLWPHKKNNFLIWQLLFVCYHRTVSFFLFVLFNFLFTNLIFCVYIGFPVIMVINQAHWFNIHLVFTTGLLLKISLKGCPFNVKYHVIKWCIQNKEITSYTTGKMTIHNTHQYSIYNIDKIIVQCWQGLRVPLQSCAVAIVCR